MLNDEIKKREDINFHNFSNPWLELLDWKYYTCKNYEA
jgi:hypothetical protein